MNKIPEWLTLQAKIDFNLFLLNQMLEAEQALTSFEKMIDEATGFQDTKMKEATKIMKRIDRLKKRYYNLSIDNVAT